MEKTFEYNDLTFEIRLTSSGTSVQVATYLNGKQVSPVYSASLEVDEDYFHGYHEHICKSLFEIAESDIREGVYVRNPSTSQDVTVTQAND
jgi:hypothetical protein